MSKYPTRAALVAALLILPMVGAGDEGPKSPKARAAISKYEKAVERANADRDRAIAAAAKDLRAELDASLKAAMKAGSLEEAKAIEAAMPGKGDTPNERISLDGHWNVVYANNHARVYIIDGDRIEWEGQRTGALRRSGKSVLCDLRDGKVERFTPAGPDGFFIEHFSRPADYADSAPGDVLAVATRIR